MNDFPDGADYVRIALTVFTEHRYPEEHFFARPPLYPLLLVPSAGGGPMAVILWAKLLNIVAGLVAVQLAACLVGELNTAAANVAAMTVACNPMLVYFATWVSTESVYTALLLATLLLITKAMQRSSIRALLLAGLLLGLTILCRPTAQAIGAGLVIAMLCFPRACNPLIRMRRAGLLLLSCTLTIAPWTVRNLIRHGEFIAVSDGGGLMFYLANSDFGQRLEAAATRQEYLTLEHELYSSVLPQLLDSVRDLGPSSRDRFFFSLSASWIRSHPRAFALSTLRRLGRFLSPWVSPYAYSTKMALTSAIWLVPLYAIGIPALGAKVRRQDTMARLALLVVVATVGTVGAFFHTELRYRVPNVDLFLGVLGGAFVGERLFASRLSGWRGGVVG